MNEKHDPGPRVYVAPVRAGGGREVSYRGSRLGVAGSLQELRALLAKNGVDFDYILLRTEGDNCPVVWVGEGPDVWTHCRSE